MLEKSFKIISKNKPAGDQPQAIEKLVHGLKKRFKHQTLLGVTGSGKTFTVANVIEQIQKPTLVIAHNKTLAAQLCNEFRELFPENSVNYFVSYYDYYQPEAYMPATDTYIDKEAMINDEIDKLRHMATTALLTRRDTVVVASVSCIYDLGLPKKYEENLIHFKIGDKIERKELMKKLVQLQYSRTNSDLKRGSFRVRGENWEIMPPFEEMIYNFVLKHGFIDKIYRADPVKGFNDNSDILEEAVISPAKHFIALGPEKEGSLKNIKQELKESLKRFEAEKKYLEAERLERRVKFDLAMIKEVGYCHGIENYSRHLSGRFPGEPPSTLLDYFPGDFLTVIDESHVSIPQIGGMYNGNEARKKTLIEYGFRLPSAIDNRPLKFKEFENKIGQVIYTSATPANYEREKSEQIVEQVIRPTGLVDPKITIRPAKGQVQDLVEMIKKRLAKKDLTEDVSLRKGFVKEFLLPQNRPARDFAGVAPSLSRFAQTLPVRSQSRAKVLSQNKIGRTLITTLTKKMAEDLSAYLEELGIKVNYLHSDVKTLDRIKILTGLRRGDFDVLVGVNLLREGLDLPEVSLVAILDADKEGFLRSETSLIQTIGRAARNADGEVLIYADKITGSIKKAVDETERRRNLQIEYNKRYNITPKTIIKEITDILPAEKILELETKPIPKSVSAKQKLIKQKERGMKEAAQKPDIELAAILRDEIRVLTAKNPKQKN